jgi:flagellin-specific chaperone FliS
MKIKHNKKRNTAFVYEALVKEATVAILKNDSEKKDKAIKIIKKHFKPGSVLNFFLLLTYYISSFADNALELKTFLNEEIPRLKEQLEKAKKLNEIKEDEEMFNKTQKVIEHLNSFADKNVNENILLTIMRTQKLVKEIYPDADNS